jgi:DNA modification methylase
VREEIIGNARLILGDCREILPTLGKVDAVVTDPPYGIADGVMKKQNRVGKRKGSVNTWHAESWWDKELDPAWGDVCEKASIVAWFGQWRKREEVARFMKWPLRSEIVWAKDCHMGPPSPVAPRDERIWIFSESGLKPATFETSVWDHPVIPTWAHKEHKNEKPEGLMKRLVQWLGVTSVLDPFMGSGTTGVACAKLGLTFTGIEIDETHFKTACKRIEAAHKQPDLFISPAPKPVQETML